MDSTEKKKEIYNALKFSQSEIDKGEKIYKALTTPASKEEFAEIHSNNFYGREENGYWVLDKPVRLSNEIKVAIINFATHEMGTEVGHDPKVILARNLFHSFNSYPVSGPQELFEILCWWVDFETDSLVKGALVTSLVDYTTVTHEAKHKILNLIPTDYTVIESLDFWLTHNFPRNYDYDFGQQVRQTIDKYYLDKTSARSAEQTITPFEAGELLKSLSGNGFKVWFAHEWIENPDPREMGGYEQPVITIGNQKMNLWDQQVLYNEDLKLLCFLAESRVRKWSLEVTIADLSSLQIISLPPEDHYSGEAYAISSNMSTFNIKLKNNLLSIDVSEFPKVKTILK